VNISEPRVEVNPLYVKRGEGDHCWLSAWQVENFSGDEIKIVSARLPHGQFRGEEITFSPEIAVPSEGRRELILPAAFNAAPGSMVENAFLILSIEYERVPWRVFTRFRVTANARGEPEPTVERITIQKAGFSDTAGQSRDTRGSDG